MEAQTHMADLQANAHLQGGARQLDPRAATFAGMQYTPPPMEYTLEEVVHRVLAVGSNEADALGTANIEVQSSRFVTRKVTIQRIDPNIEAVLKESPDYDQIAGARWSGPPSDLVGIYLVELFFERKQTFRYPQPETKGADELPPSDAG